MKAIPLVVAGIAAISLGGCTSWLYGDEESSPTPQASSQKSSSQQSQAASPSSPTTAASPQLVRNVQQQLNEKGVKAGPVDGIWGPKTQQGVRQFQQNQGLEATGQLNGATLSALGISGEQQSASAGGSESASAGGSRSASAGGSKGASSGGSSAGSSNRLTPSFADADANNDGSVSREEFDAAFKRAR